jgi:hypothetical protein
MASTSYRVIFGLSQICPSLLFIFAQQVAVAARKKPHRPQQQMSRTLLCGTSSEVSITLMTDGSNDPKRAFSLIDTMDKDHPQNRFHQIGRCN